MNDFPKRLAVRMAEMSLNQTAVAQYLRTSQSTVSRWLAGHPPRDRLLADLCTLLNLEPKWLLEGQGPKEVVISDEAKTRLRQARNDPRTSHAITDASERTSVELIDDVEQFADGLLQLERPSPGSVELFAKGILARTEALRNRIQADTAKPPIKTSYKEKQ